MNYLENPVEVTPATGQNLVVIPFTGTSASFAGIMIPGQSGFRTINVTLENGKVYTYTHPSGIDLQPGRYTTVNLVLGRDNIKLDDAGISVSDWENGTAIDGGEATEAYSYDSNTKTITIYSGEGLKVAADVVNSGDTDLNITLDNDIDLTGIEWTPIGTESRPYTGTFDGNNYTITACYWENNQGQGIGDNQGSTTIETTKVNGTDVTWQTAVAAMNTALQSAGSGWHYELNGALPTLE